MNISKNAVGVRKNIKQHGLIIHYNTRVDIMLGVGYTDFRKIPGSCYKCLRNLYNPWNIK